MRFFKLMMLALVALGSNGAGAVTSRMVYGETGRLDAYDPYTVHEASAQRLADLIFDNLITLEPGGSYGPQLAQSWTIGKGGTSVTFKLRTDVYWHHDAADKSVVKMLTPADVVTTVRLLTASQSAIPNRERFALIAGATAAEPNQVTIRLKRATMDPLRYMMFKVLPDHMLSGVAALLRDSAFAKSPIGTGPYRFVSANQQGEVVLHANEKYFNHKPTIEDIVLKCYADQTVMSQSLMFNSLDLVTYVSPRDLNEVGGDKRLSVIPYDALSFSFFAMNTSRGVLRDRRVRQAISYAVNRQEMLTAFFQGNGKLISGPFPPTSWAYNLDVKGYEFDVNRAKQLLTAAGLKDGNGDGFLDGDNGAPLTLLFAVPLAGESEMIKRIVLAFQNYLSKIGIKVDLQFMDWLIWKKKVLGAHDFDLTIASWTFDDASNISSLFHSSSAVPWGNNFVMYRNQEVDGLLSEADATNDADKRRAIYQKLHAILAEEVPYTYLWTLMHHAAHNTRLTGVRIEPFAFFEHILSWHLEPKNEGR